MNKESYASSWGEKKERREHSDCSGKTPLTKEIILEIVPSAARIWQIQYFEYTFAGQPCFCRVNKQPTMFKNRIQRKTSGFPDRLSVPPLTLHCGVPHMRYFSIITEESNTFALLSTGTVLLEPRLGDDDDDAAARCECSLSSAPPAHSAHTVLSGMEMCSQSSEGSAQFSHLTSQGRFVDFQTNTFTQNLPQRSSGQITNLTATSGYFLHCLLIYRLSIKINASFTLLRGNLGLLYQQSCMGQASLLSHCTSERLLYFPYLFPREVILLCRMQVFNCRREIQDVGVTSHLAFLETSFFILQRT